MLRTHTKGSHPATLRDIAVLAVRLIGVTALLEAAQMAGSTVMVLGVPAGRDAVRYLQASLGAGIAGVAICLAAGAVLLVYADAIALRMAGSRQVPHGVPIGLDVAQTVAFRTLAVYLAYSALTGLVHLVFLVLEYSHVGWSPAQWPLITWEAAATVTARLAFAAWLFWRGPGLPGPAPTALPEEEEDAAPDEPAG